MTRKGDVRGGEEMIERNEHGPEHRSRENNEMMVVGRNLVQPRAWPMKEGLRIVNTLGWEEEPVTNTCSLTLPTE